MSAIKHDFAVLASPNATDEEKRAALKFLGHWVGDIHQPLHAASRDDRGGNHIRTLGSSCESLHTLWDSCIVEERLGMHPLTIVPEIRAGITDEQRAEWLASDPVDWANDSFAIARKPEFGYCIMVDGTCQYTAENREFDQSKPEKVVVVDDSYLDRHAPIARERIAMAEIAVEHDRSRSLGSGSSRLGPGQTIAPRTLPVRLEQPCADPVEAQGPRLQALLSSGLLQARRLSAHSSRAVAATEPTTALAE